MIPGTDNVLGVSIPQLRKFAKQLAAGRQDDWHPFVESTDIKYYEEAMLQGMIIGIARMDDEERMKYIRLFVPAGF